MARRMPGSSHTPGLRRVLGRRDLILLFIVAVANLNMVPPISASGPITLWLWLIAMLLFFWPQGAAVTELAQKWPGEGGIYLWAKRGFGEQHGFFAGWCYWLSNVFYLPTVVLSCVGVGVYVFGPRVQRFADSPAFTASMATALLLFLLILNIRGLELGKWINNLGGAGTIGGAAVVVLLAGITLHHHQSSFHRADIRPVFHDWRLLPAFGTICYSLVGLDLASIMGDEICEPKRNLPVAIFWGGLAAAAIYLGTTMAMLIALPHEQIGILSGVLQAINVMSLHNGLSFVVAPLAFLECLAILGTASAWFSGAGRLPFVAGIDRYLPAVVGKVHPRYHTPYVSLIIYAALSALLTLLSFFGVTVGEAYLTMLDLAVILQLLPSCYMFAALLKHALAPDAKLHTSKPYLIANALAGLLATLVGIGVAFVPSRQVSSIWIYEGKLLTACVLIFGSAYLFYRRAARNQHVATALDPLPQPAAVFPTPTERSF
ncbi:APC family permease [Silvibacterium sp.]|uniref:APC family permease n=1 Tax=Silvibacterium sp. TaxID=1964179 RepID=UPI0039E2F134